eukprot:GILJ01008099.1.p1 GENE.GILJ01008099.1~~GILJ01008099.1.p1  ORF type:complete len:1805 (-),score=352.94 GILJ01008099.1:174-5429(-)
MQRILRNMEQRRTLSDPHLIPKKFPSDRTTSPSLRSPPSSLRMALHANTQSPNQRGSPSRHRVVEPENQQVSEIKKTLEEFKSEREKLWERNMLQARASSPVPGLSNADESIQAYRDRKLAETAATSFEENVRQNRLMEAGMVSTEEYKRVVQNLNKASREGDIRRLKLQHRVEELEREIEVIRESNQRLNQENDLRSQRSDTIKNATNRETENLVRENLKLKQELTKQRGMKETFLKALEYTKTIREHLNIRPRMKELRDRSSDHPSSPTSMSMLEEKRLLEDLQYITVEIARGTAFNSQALHSNGRATEVTDDAVRRTLAFVSPPRSRINSNQAQADDAMALLRFESVRVKQMSQEKEMLRLQVEEERNKYEKDTRELRKQIEFLLSSTHKKKDKVFDMIDVIKTELDELSAQLYEANLLSARQIGSITSRRDDLLYGKLDDIVRMCERPVSSLDQFSANTFGFGSSVDGIATTEELEALEDFKLIHLRVVGFVKEIAALRKRLITGSGPSSAFLPSHSILGAGSTGDLTSLQHEHLLQQLSHLQEENRYLYGRLLKHPELGGTKSPITTIINPMGSPDPLSNLSLSAIQSRKTDGAGSPLSSAENRRRYEQLALNLEEIRLAFSRSELPYVRQETVNSFLPVDPDLLVKKCLVQLDSIQRDVKLLRRRTCPEDYLEQQLAEFSIDEPVTRVLNYLFVFLQENCTFRRIITEYSQFLDRDYNYNNLYNSTHSGLGVMNTNLSNPKRDIHCQQITSRIIDAHDRIARSNLKDLKRNSRGSLLSSETDLASLVQQSDSAITQAVEDVTNMEASLSIMRDSSNVMLSLWVTVSLDLIQSVKELGTAKKLSNQQTLLLYQTNSPSKPNPSNSQNAPSNNEKTNAAGYAKQTVTVNGTSETVLEGENRELIQKVHMARKKLKSADLAELKIAARLRYDSEPSVTSLVAQSNIIIDQVVQELRAYATVSTVIFGSNQSASSPNAEVYHETHNLLLGLLEDLCELRKHQNVYSKVTTDQQSHISILSDGSMPRPLSPNRQSILSTLDAERLKQIDSIVRQFKDLHQRLRASDIEDMYRKTNAATIESVVSSTVLPKLVLESNQEIANLLNASDRWSSTWDPLVVQPGFAYSLCFAAVKDELTSLFKELCVMYKKMNDSSLELRKQLDITTETLKVATTTQPTVATTAASRNVTNPRASTVIDNFMASTSPFFNRFLELKREIEATNLRELKSSANTNPDSATSSDLAGLVDRSNLRISQLKSDSKVILKEWEAENDRLIRELHDDPQSIQEWTMVFQMLSHLLNLSYENCDYRKSVNQYTLVVFNQKMRMDQISSSQVLLEGLSTHLLAMTEKLRAISAKQARDSRGALTVNTGMVMQQQSEEIDTAVNRFKTSVQHMMSVATAQPPEYVDSLIGQITVIVTDNANLRKSLTQANQGVITGEPAVQFNLQPISASGSARPGSSPSTPRGGTPQSILKNRNSEYSSNPIDSSMYSSAPAGSGMGSMSSLQASGLGPNANAANNAVPALVRKCEEIVINALEYHTKLAATTLKDIKNTDSPAGTESDIVQLIKRSNASIDQIVKDAETYFYSPTLAGSMTMYADVVRRLGDCVMNLMRDTCGSRKKSNKYLHLLYVQKAAPTVSYNSGGPTARYDLFVTLADSIRDRMKATGLRELKGDRSITAEPANGGMRDLVQLSNTKIDALLNEVDDAIRKESTASVGPDTELVHNLSLHLLSSFKENGFLRKAINSYAIQLLN